MSDDAWKERFEAIYRAALTAYRSGVRSPEAIVDADARAFLASIGLRPIHVYDYAEDWVRSGEPEWEAVLRMAELRRGHFLEECGGAWPDLEIRNADLPPKDAEHKGVRWLPRIIRKASGFLHGELSAEIMYCCGGDRSFLRKHALHPADFLALVKRHRGEPDAIHHAVTRTRPSRNQD